MPQIINLRKVVFSLAMFAIVVVLGLGSASKANAEAVGVCNVAGSTSQLGNCTKTVTLTGNTFTIVLTNTSPAANGGYITADAFNLTAGTTVNSWTSSNSNFTFTAGLVNVAPYTPPRNALFSISSDFEGGGSPLGGVAVGNSVTFTVTLADLNGNTEASILNSEIIRFRGFNDGGSDKVPIGSPVPEPTSMLLLGTGLVGVAGAARRRFRK